ncbi:unnamed protein product [Merluccius merluccius]
MHPDSYLLTWESGAMRRCSFASHPSPTPAPPPDAATPKGTKAPEGPEEYIRLPEELGGFLICIDKRVEYITVFNRTLDVEHSAFA